MKKHKAIRMLSSLSKVELNRLNKLVNSPFFNKNQHVTDLFNYLTELYPDFIDEQIDKHTTYAAVYPDKKYNDSRLRNTASDLTKLIEKYLLLNDLEKKPGIELQSILAEAKNRGLNKLQESSIKQWEQIQTNNPYKDVSFYFSQHQLQEELYEFTALKVDRSLKSSLQELNDNLDIYYISKKLKYCCEMINRKNIFAEEYDLGLFNEVMTYLSERKFDDIPVIKIYYQILLTLIEGDKEEHYFQLKELLEKHSDLFPQNENKVNYSFAQNYCVKKINSGRAEYLKELFDLYQLSLEKHVIFEGDRLSQWDFKNITTVGLRLDEMERTKAFIENYKQYIDPRYQENAYRYNLANYHFYAGNFKQAMQLLVQVEFTDVYYNLDSRSLLLKVYYELEEYEALFPHSETFKNFLRRNGKISDYQKKVYLNLVKYLTKLAKLRLSYKTIPQKLVDTINTTPQIADATWLRKKAANLKNT